MDPITRGVAPEREAVTLQVFLRACGADINPDGMLGPATTKAIRDFQQRNGLIADGVAGEKTWTTLFAQQPALLSEMSSKWLSQKDIDDFAAANDLEVPLVRTVYSVESGGSGFVGVKPKILFEGHVFWDQLKAAGIDPRQAARGHEDIVFEEWNPRSYAGGLAEYDRLERARRIAEGPALASASWGLFQILGLHAKSLGYGDVKTFVDAMGRNEAEQLKAFGAFIKVNSHKGRRLVDWLRDHAWDRFAAGYNGPSYLKNQYDTRLAQAYAKYSALA